MSIIFSYLTLQIGHLLLLVTQVSENCVCPQGINDTCFVILIRHMQHSLVCSIFFPIISSCSCLFFLHIAYNTLQ